MSKKHNQYHFRLDDCNAQYIDKIFRASGFETKQAFLEDLVVKFAAVHNLHAKHITQIQKCADTLDQKPHMTMATVLDGYFQIFNALHFSYKKPHIAVRCVLFLLGYIERKKILKFLDPFTGKRAS